MWGNVGPCAPARLASYSLAKSARATYAAATTAAATASGGNDLAAGAGGERSAFGGVAQRFAGLLISPRKSMRRRARSGPSKNYLANFS